MQKKKKVGTVLGASFYSYTVAKESGVIKLYAPEHLQNFFLYCSYFALEQTCDF